MKSSAIKKHLESVTGNALLQHKNTAFMCFASGNGVNGFVQVGCNATGEYVVILNGITQTRWSADSAAQLYANLLTEKIDEQ